jgi:hypothetical protein
MITLKFFSIVIQLNFCQKVSVELNNETHAYNRQFSIKFKLTECWKHQFSLFYICST